MSRYVAILIAIVASQCLAEAPQAQMADVVAFERTPEEGLRGAVRYRLEIQRQQQELARLKQQRLDLKAHLVARWMVRPEVLDVATERDAARASLKLASDAALMALRKRDEYRIARDAHNAARAKLEAIREVGPAADMTSATSDVVETSGGVGRMEAEAVAKSPEVLVARKRIAEADATYAAMQKDAVAAAESHRQYKELSQAIEDTLADLDAAAEDLAQAQANAAPREGEFASWEESLKWESYDEVMRRHWKQRRAALSQPQRQGIAVDPRPWRITRHRSIPEP